MSDKQPPGNEKTAVWNRSGDTGGRYDWRTPRALYDLLNEEFEFTTDAAANDDNHLADHYFTPERSAFTESWAGLRVFCNPPYGRVITDWIQKGYQEGFGYIEGLCAEVVVMLIPAKPDTAYWWRYCRYGQVRFLPGRLKFDPPVGVDAAPNSAGFPSAVVVFGGTYRAETLYWDWRPRAAKLAARRPVEAGPRIGG